MSEIELEGVTVAFGDVAAVDGVDLRVRDGELLVLVGPSGCGKTTLLRTVAGLEQPVEGEVFVDGRRVTDLPARMRDVSLVFQDFALFPHLTARENVAFDLRMQGVDDVDARVREVAALLEIGDLLDRSIDELSGGQKQRVALGRAIVTDPSAFLLDEPLANLDASLRERMRTEIARLQEELDVTTIHVTHDQAEALTMGDRVAVMRGGHVEQVGSPEAVYRRPASLFVAEFVGSPAMNLLPGRYVPDVGAVEVGDGDDRHAVTVDLATDAGAADPDDDGVLDLDDGGSRESGDGSAPIAGAEIVVGVRPEHVEVATDRRIGDNWLDGTVRLDEFNGADRYLYLAVPGLRELVARVPAETAVDVGQVVSVRLSRDRVHCFDTETGRRLPTAGRSRPDAFEFPEDDSP